MQRWHIPILILVMSLSYSYWLSCTPPIIALVYFLASVLSYCLTANDKKAAKIGAWRVSEKTLHWTALLGGWPGSVLAQQKLRHKTQKRRFRIVFVVTVCLNVGGLAYLHTSSGSDKLYSFTQHIDRQLMHIGSDNNGVKVALMLTGFRQTR